MNVPRTEADVVRLAQLGCLDFHPWLVRDEDTDHPDELRFDFEPDSGSHLRSDSPSSVWGQGAAR